MYFGSEAAFPHMCIQYSLTWSLSVVAVLNFHLAMTFQPAGWPPEGECVSIVRHRAVTCSCLFCALTGCMACVTVV